MPDVKKAGGIIYAENIHAYLLIYNGEKWGFPKGSMNKQETEEQCAVI